MKITLQLSMLLLLAATTEIASTCDFKPNGCSIPAKYKKWVGWKGTFTPACNKHDVCYFCGGQGYHKWTKQECDDAFYRDMKKACKKTNRGFLGLLKRAECKFWAFLYYKAVCWSRTAKKAWNTPYCKEACRPSEGDPNTILS